MFRIFTFTLLLTGLTFFAQAQQRGICGNMPSAKSDAMIMAAKAFLEKHPEMVFTEDLKYIPIKFHLIADSDGNGRVREVNVIKQLCVINQDYADTDFRFYIKDGFSYKDNDFVYNSPRGNQIATNHMLALKQANNNAINVFIVNNIGGGAGGGTVLGYYDTNYDWIVLLKGEVNQGTNTLSHETGHFFSLQHTFYGWEGAPFGPGSPGWPIAPFNSPGGPQTEKQDGSNCTVAADKVCDTPPDYNFGLIWPNGDCNYTGGAKDPMGTLVDPMENNQMSYFSGCYPYVFTPDQISLMYANYAKSSRDYIKSSYVPNMTQITQKPVSPAPANNSTGISPIGVVLDWEDIPNASQYVVEVSRTTNFSNGNMTFVVNESQVALPSLEYDKNYFWKVTPFNDGFGCVNGLTSSKWKFTTSPDATSDIDEIAGWSINPNPSKGILRLAFKATKAVDLQSEVLTAEGKVLLTEKIRLQPGTHVKEFPQFNLPCGIYFVRLSSEKGVETKRLVVMK